MDSKIKVPSRAIIEEQVARAERDVKKAIESITDNTYVTSWARHKTLAEAEIRLFIWQSMSNDPELCIADLRDKLLRNSYRPNCTDTFANAIQNTWGDVASSIVRRYVMDEYY